MSKYNAILQIVMAIEKVFMKYINIVNKQLQLKKWKMRIRTKYVPSKLLRILPSTYLETLSSGTRLYQGVESFFDILDIYINIFSFITL